MAAIEGVYDSGYDNGGGAAAVEPTAVGLAASDGEVILSGWFRWGLPCACT